MQSFLRFASVVVFAQFVPNLVPLVKDPNTHVKLTAERALMHALLVQADETMLKVCKPYHAR